MPPPPSRDHSYLPKIYHFMFTCLVRFQSRMYYLCLYSLLVSLHEIIWLILNKGLWTETVPGTLESTGWHYGHSLPCCFSDLIDCPRAYDMNENGFAWEPSDGTLVISRVCSKSKGNTACQCLRDSCSRNMLAKNLS